MRRRHDSAHTLSQKTIMKHMKQINTNLGKSYVETNILKERKNRCCDEINYTTR